MREGEHDNTKGNGFGVPGSYFNNSAAGISHRIACSAELKGFTRLQALKGKFPFQVPDGYFENEKEVKFAAKFEISGGQPFTIPADYFDRKRPDLIGIAEPRVRHRSVRIIKLYGSQAGWAAAAVLLIVFGLWMFLQPAVLPVQDCEGIACLDRTELLGSGAVENLSDEELMQLVDTDKLDRKLFQENDLDS